MSNVRWQTADTGILRKKDDRVEELFVFGYSCRIFNDYDKALFIDQGKHLIPWMGDETLKIDRYDCRGTLSDLTPYIGNSSNYDPWMGFTTEERKIEQLCDKERYRALNSNEDEENIYQEEELKRLHQALNNEKTYSEVGYNYDKTNENESSLQTNDANDDNEPFVPSCEMDIPMGIKLPETKKQHGIIEKTALFINQQGPQMEVLLKIKQAGNSQFQFLSFDNELYSYYRYLLTAVKNKHYKPESSYKKDLSLEGTRDDYLHPTLNIGSSEMNTELAPTIPTINYKPSADCAYSVLVNRIKESSATSLLEEIKKSSRKSRSASPSDGDRSRISHSGSTNSSGSSSPSSRSRSRSRSSGGKPESIIDDVGELLKPPSPPQIPLSALSKSARRRHIRKQKQREAAESYKIYYVEEQTLVDDDSSSRGEVDDEKQENDKENHVSAAITTTKSKVDVSESINPTLERAASSVSSSSTSTIVSSNQVPAPAAVVYVPPADVQLIVDKMASYVAKNGRDFEDIVRNKGDPRFSFLEPTHMYNPYYNQKVELYLQLDLTSDVANSAGQVNKPAPSTTDSSKVSNTGGQVKNEVSKTDASTSAKKPPKSSKSHKPKPPLPICFSIKKPRDQETLEIKSALPNEESGDESNNETSECDEESLKDDKMKSVLKSAAASSTSKLSGLENGDIVNTKESSADKKVTQSLSDSMKKSTISPESWAKEKIKAKLVMTAKGKIAAKEKDKQLQAERRRKAAQFINLLQKENMMTNLQQLSAASLMVEAAQRNSGNSQDEIISIGSSSADSDAAITKAASKKSSSKTHHTSEKSGKHKRRRRHEYSSDFEDEEDSYKRRKYSFSSKHKTYKRKKDSDKHKKSHKKRKKQNYKDEDKYRGDHHRKSKKVTAAE